MTLIIMHWNQNLSDITLERFETRQLFILSQHDDRTNLITDFTRILKSQDFEELETAYNACLENGTKYPQWIKYVQNYQLFKEKWRLAHRDEQIRGQRTNNYSEANIRIFKDVVLQESRLIMPHHLLNLYRRIRKL